MTPLCDQYHSCPSCDEEGGEKLQFMHENPGSEEEDAGPVYLCRNCGPQQHWDNTGDYCWCEK